VIAAGYMAKHVCAKPECLRADQVVDIYSVSACMNDNFAADYINFWKHNGYWLFDSPEIIRCIARDQSIDIEGTHLFYYEVYEQEFDGKTWNSFLPDGDVNVVTPAHKRIEGFDVVTFYCGTSPECSPLSCNSLAVDIPTNSHCLLPSFDDAYSRLNLGEFEHSEPGPYRIFAVYAAD
jgi:hypothetical protein